jgi:hypothetical protein
MDHPVSKQTPDFRRVLTEDWTVTWERPAYTDRITVPEGTVYNPSIPGVAHSIVPVSRAMVASAPHDDLYRSKGAAKSTTIRRTLPDGTTFDVPAVSRRYADRLFRYVLRAVGVAEWRVQLAYGAVRSFGWYAWTNN